MPTSVDPADASFDGLSIVVVTWNSKRELPDLLASIKTHLPEPYEVIVVDNDSADRTVELAREWDGPCRVIVLDENLGFGAANNIGVRAARYEAVVLLNPDTLLVDGSLVDLAKLALETGAICGPELLNPDGTRQPSASPTPARWEVLVDSLLPARVMPAELRNRCEPWRSTGTLNVGWLTGACLSAPRRVLTELGPFDETIHLYGEDLDLGLRAMCCGTPCLFTPDTARVTHLGARSSQTTGEGPSPTSLKLRRRRAVVRAHFGSHRERYDFACQLVFHAGRYITKTVLRLDAAPERDWLASARVNRSVPLL